MDWDLAGVTSRKCAERLYGATESRRFCRRIWAPKSRRGVIWGGVGSTLNWNSMRVVIRGRWHLTGKEADIFLRGISLLLSLLYHKAMFPTVVTVTEPTPQSGHIADVLTAEGKKNKRSLTPASSPSYYLRDHCINYIYITIASLEWLDSSNNCAICY